MEKLTLTLHKTKDTKNKVVYGTKDGDVIQSVYIDKDALGGSSTGHAPSGHIRTVSIEADSLAGEPRLGNRAEASRR